ncbi:MAG: prolyl oligopeptidase family serine peptidase [Chloroflexi bacterium]|nr:prolyl oligopeptidase family serine peptidase [Chloroflexota bacterium]MBI5715950.1 prolyl oligopeptidase family serine peptidase [Chloroflexota bacterium]
MPKQKTAPYGSWKSPITSSTIVAKAIAIGLTAVDGDDIYWIEQRAQEAGRNVIVKRSADGKIADVTPAAFNARTRVHEYGGGAFCVDDGTVYFSNFKDQRLYRQVKDRKPAPLTPEKEWRYADAVVDRSRKRLICIREDHTDKSKQAVNSLVSVDLNNGSVNILTMGNDFYSNPRLSPDGRKLAWLTWNHPNMPWDGTELWTATMSEDGTLANAKKIAGGEDEAIFQPEWSPSGMLHFVSDKSGWSNLYRYNGTDVKALCPMEADFNRPQWVFGARTYDFESADRIICSYTQDGKWFLARLDTTSGAFEIFDLPYCDITYPRVMNRAAVFVAGAIDQPTALIKFDLITHKVDVIKAASKKKTDTGYLSAPQSVEFPTENGLAAYGIFYPPHNKDYAAPADERPPLLVLSHGGPTSASPMSLRSSIQYWTSRGIAVLDVNYGGSTGYGRAYRERLNGQWGVVDVDDCVNGARYLVERGDVDGNRLAIAGGSAGGYTTLCALTFRDTFKAGASHFGIGELEVFVKDTHKYESRYCDRLIGPYPQRRDLYLARSPINFLDRINCPMILFQGLEDKIVPPNQAQMMFEAVKKKGLPVAYLPFAGEQHGFRQAKNIKRSLDAELYFYSRVFGFKLTEKIKAVKIENMEEPRRKKKRK